MKMKIILPEKKTQKLQVGDVLKTVFSGIYILSQFTDKQFAWFNLDGSCANGKYDSLEQLQQASNKFFKDPEYVIYSASDYDLKLVKKGEN